MKERKYAKKDHFHKPKKGKGYYKRIKKLKKFELDELDETILRSL